MPHLLLDTHAFLQWVNDDPKLTAAARRAIADVANECYLSMASCWEMAIKSSLGKLKLASPIEQFIPEQLAANGFNLLDLTLRHIAMVEKLPFHHRDPFDRLLIVQAIAEKMVIVSADSVFPDYGVKSLW